MWELVTGILFVLLGCALLDLGIFIFRYHYALKCAHKYIKTYGIQSGLFVKHGMVIDPKTGLVRSTQSPSQQAIKFFW